MKLLFAAPDRDLLSCYRKLLTTPEREVSTAFDGTQVVAKLAETRFDLAILSSDLPRVGWRRLAGLLREAGIPAILLTLEPPEEDAPVSASLTLPFLPEELNALMEQVLVRETWKEGDMA